MRGSMKIIVAGSRTFTDYKFICEWLDYFAKKWGLRLEPSQDGHEGRFMLVSGNAKGPDKLAERWAFERRCSADVYPANWVKHGKSAGPLRNELMASKADALVAFWDGVSPGTRDMIERARKHKLKVAVVKV